MSLNVAIPLIFAVGLAFVLLYASVLPPLWRFRLEQAYLREISCAEQAFEILLSGNLALLMRDNFNQLESALSLRRVRRVLLNHWGLKTQADCRHMLQSRLECIGRMSSQEKGAIAAWLLGESNDSNEFAALDESCSYMVVTAGIAEWQDLQHERLNVLAWDVQQLAYLARLAYTLGFLSQSETQGILSMLGVRARANFGSWRDYSLAALVGIGLRGSLDDFDRSEWARFAHSHKALMSRSSRLAWASEWCDAASRQ